eukprot:gene12700-17031_t
MNKWCIFIHGISSNGEQHGKAIFNHLSSFLEGSEWNMFFSKANTSIHWSTLSLFYTLQGVEAMADSILSEIIYFFANKPPPTHISIIGASFGGLVALLHDCLFINYVNYGECVICTRDLYLLDDSNNWLEELGSNPTYLDVYSKFRKRIIYAPIWDDGIVSYASASLLGTKSSLSLVSMNSSPLVSEASQEITLEMIPELPEFMKNDILHDKAEDIYVQKVLNIMLGMASCGWKLFDVNTDHKVLATLHDDTLVDISQATSNLRLKINACQEIAAHLVKQMLTN